MMPFFKFTINDSDESVIGNDNFDFLEFGLISVGPKFEVDLLSNGIYKGKSDAENYLNKKVNIGDVIMVAYYGSEPNVSNYSELNSIKKSKNIESKNNVRQFRVSQEDEKNILISAAGSTSLNLNFIWTKKENKCKFILGNTDYNGNEQWTRLLVNENQKFKVEIE